ncbi:MAG: type I restriction-modification enzyme R subunit C-terminal domain-containing protein [Micropruina sp.]
MGLVSLEVFVCQHRHASYRIATLRHFRGCPWPRRFSVDTAAQIDFVNLIISELTANGVMEAARLYESPFTDRAPQGPDLVFTDHDLDLIIDTLNQVRAHAVPEAEHG